MDAAMKLGPYIMWLDTGRSDCAIVWTFLVTFLIHSRYWPTHWPIPYLQSIPAKNTDIPWYFPIYSFTRLENHLNVIYKYWFFNYSPLYDVFSSLITSYLISFIQYLKLYTCVQCSGNLLREPVEGFLSTLKYFPSAISYIKRNIHWMFFGWCSLDAILLDVIETLKWRIEFIMLTVKVFSSTSMGAIDPILNLHIFFAPNSGAPYFWSLWFVTICKSY